MKQIEKITMKIEEDLDPDLSYLGELSYKPTNDKHWIPTNPDDITDTTKKLGI